MIEEIVSIKMDIRDYFASQALIGLIFGRKSINDEIIRIAYKVADAMLVEREYKRIEPRGINGGVDE
jgi:hypothetical protein